MFLCFGFFGCEACENLSSPTMDLTHTPCIRRQSLNHWAASEVPVLLKIYLLSYSIWFVSYVKISENEWHLFH